VHFGAAGLRLGVAGLLEQALALHAEHHEGVCPVCGTPDLLDAGWRTRAERELSRLRGMAAAAQRTIASANEARRRARALILPVPPVLDQAEMLGLNAGAVLDARRRWRVPDPALWATTPQSSGRGRRASPAPRAASRARVPPRLQRDGLSNSGWRSRLNGWLARSGGSVAVVWDGRRGRRRCGR
jgi:hypothetical protein